MNTQARELEITQEDREAAASVLPPSFRDAVLRGYHDTEGPCSSTVQAFARHRISSRADAGEGDGWQDIETAPKDGTLIDLWCVSPPESDFVPENGGIRLTNCAWETEKSYWPYTGWSRVLDDGDMDLVDGPPVAQHGLPRWVPTHWRLPPSPPSSTPPQAG